MQSTATIIPEAESVDIDSLPDSQLLDPKQAAASIRVSPGTLSVWRCTGRYSLRFVKVGHKVYYKAGDLRAFIERRSRQHTAEGVSA